MSRKSRMNEEPFDLQTFWEEMDRTVLAEYHKQDFYLNNRNLAKPKEPTLEEIDQQIEETSAIMEKAKKDIASWGKAIAEFQKTSPNGHVTLPGYVTLRSAEEQMQKLKAKREQLLKTQK